MVQIPPQEQAGLDFVVGELSKLDGFVRKMGFFLKQYGGERYMERIKPKYRVAHTQFARAYLSDGLVFQEPRAALEPVIIREPTMGGYSVKFSQSRLGEEEVYNLKGEEYRVVYHKRRGQSSLFLALLTDKLEQLGSMSSGSGSP